MITDDDQFLLFEAGKRDCYNIRGFTNGQVVVEVRGVPARFKNIDAAIHFYAAEPSQLAKLIVLELKRNATRSLSF